MLKELSKLERAKLLTKVEQQKINGGIICWYRCSDPQPSPPCICFEWD